MPPLARRFRPYQQQAETEAEIRYGGQQAGLESLFGSRTRDYQRQAAAQQTAFRSLLGSLGTASSRLNQTYNDAGLTPEARAQFANTPDGQRLLAQLARDQGAIQQQQLGAETGQQFIQARMADDYREDVDQINDSLLGLQRERGLFEQQALSGLIGEDRARRSQANAAARQQQFDAEQAISNREAAQTNALIGQGLLPDAEGNLQPLPGGKADPNAPGNQPEPKSPWAPQGAQSSARSTISKAFAQAKRLKREGRARREAATFLTEGRPGQQVVDRKGNKVNIPGVPSFEELYASIALDLAYDGHISRRNVQELHRAGIKVRPLGYKTPNDIPKPKSYEERIRDNEVAGPPDPRNRR